MKSSSIITQIEGIESQLVVLKGLVGRNIPHRKSAEKGLLQMKGILKQRGKFSKTEISNALVRYPNV